MKPQSIEVKIVNYAKGGKNSCLPTSWSLELTSFSALYNGRSLTWFILPLTSSLLVTKSIFKHPAFSVPSSLEPEYLL